MRGAPAIAACLVAALAAARPAAQDPPLPDSAPFLREMRDNLLRERHRSPLYAYKERRTDIHMNPFGRMGMGDTRVFEVRPHPHPQLTYRREIERNGVPLRDVDLVRQDRQYKAKADEIVRRLNHENADERRARERDEALVRARAEAMVRDVAQALQFRVVKREVFEGTPAIVVAFSPRPDARPITREGRIASGFTGRLWVKEATREVMHLDAEAVDDITFGGFLGKIYKGTRAILDREEIEPGVWMPTRMTFIGEGRALFRRIKIDLNIQWFDYRKVDDGDYCGLWDLTRGYSKSPSAAQSNALTRRASASDPPPASPRPATTAAFPASSVPIFPGTAADATLASRAKVSMVSPSRIDIGWPIARNTNQISTAISR